jgi:hypothetical protein
MLSLENGVGVATSLVFLFPTSRNDHEAIGHALVPSTGDAGIRHFSLAGLLVPNNHWWETFFMRIEEK